MFRRVSLTAEVCRVAAGRGDITTLQLRYNTPNSMLVHILYFEKSW